MCCNPLGCKETQLSEEQQQLVYVVYTQFGNSYKIQGDLFLLIGNQFEIAAVKVTAGRGRLLTYISPEPHPDPGSRSLMLLICGSDFMNTSLTES